MCPVLRKYVVRTEWGNSTLKHGEKYVVFRWTSRMGVLQVAHAYNSNLYGIDTRPQILVIEKLVRYGGQNVASEVEI